MFVDVLLGRTLVAEHLPADEVLIRNHDTEASIRLRDALHLLEPATHVEKVLQRAEARHVVERAIPKGQRFPCPDRDLGMRRDLFGEFDRLIGEIDAHGVHVAGTRSGQQ